MPINSLRRTTLPAFVAPSPVAFGHAPRQSADSYALLDPHRRRPTGSSGFAPRAVPAPAVPSSVGQKPVEITAAELLRRIAAGKTSIHIDPRVRDSVLEMLQKLAVLPEGLKLLRKIVEHVRHLDIVFARGISPHTHTGMSSHSNRPDAKSAIIEISELHISVYDRQQTLHEIPPYFILAHEMLHAYHGARWPGLEEALACSEVEDYSNLEEYASIEGMSPEVAEQVARAYGNRVDPATLQKYGKISENSLRAQAGMPERYGHDGVEGDPHAQHGRRRGQQQDAELWQMMMQQWGLQPGWG